MSDSPDAVVGEMNEDRDATCPVVGVTRKDPQGASIRDWWPNQLNVNVLAQNSAFWPRTPPSPIPWARSSTTRRSSRPSTSGS